MPQIYRNPSSLIEEEIEPAIKALQEEVEKLKERLKALETK